MGAPIVHFEVNVKDLAKAKEFYGTLFGWKLQDYPPMNYAMVDTAVKMGINGGLAQVEPDKPVSTIIYAQVEDPQVYLDKAVSLGARVVLPVTVIPDAVTLALFADPDGCVVGLVKGPQSMPEAKPKARKRLARKKPVKASRGKGKKKRGKK